MKAAMKAPMKAAMKKGMKKKTVGKIATGPRMRAAVFRGGKAKTVGGLTKELLTKTTRGRLVSRKASAASKKKYVNSAAKKWCDACSAARKALGITGFVAIGGQTAAGKALYAKAKSLM
eukprot:CAMPEP_0183441692 /NCGR_PEP_ID=MMETSP0370-20130417/85638_1 /TAXON_ID=268820 /ORGANISM="Peridinium aciculiferum, Strain PAER-2" /LENGTH=118 /DNA_ID=CAMNT_0025630981 /DNA_START=91 /DNA_END=447 /DNA_ORIENTATION=+